MEWRSWLEENHATATGIWLVRFKKQGRGPYVPYDDVVEEALCFGWIDSRPRRVDADRSAVLVTPRRPGSRWSKVNKTRIARLMEDGLLAPAGLAAVDAARTNGSWDALDDVENLVEPDDLASALKENPTARAEWDGFPPSTRRAILEWILSAKRAPTRQRRIEETVAEAAVGRRANQWRQPRAK